MDAALKAKITSAGSRPDPVTTEIVRNGLIAATEEMKTNLMRTAYNMIIYEALDFTVGLFDAEGNTISIGLGLPMFIRGMSDTVKAKLEHYGVENLDPGDILLTNDAYTTGSHLNHMTFSVPIFHEGELVAFSCCMAHWPDVGGTIVEGTTDIYSEGIQIPIVIGIGGLLLGIPLMVLCAAKFREFFSRKTEVAPEGLLDATKGVA